MDHTAFVANAREAAHTARLRGAPINVPIAVAQACLESDYGNSHLAQAAKNVLGIKAGGSWTGPTLDLPTREWSAERGFYDTTARWRKYPSLQACFEDYGRIIANLSWYADAAAVKDDPRAYLEALVNPGEPGWATDPEYAANVWAVCEQHNLLKPLLPETPAHEPEDDGDLLTIVWNGDPADLLKLISEVTWGPSGRVVLRGVFASTRRGEKLDLREA